MAEELRVTVLSGVSAGDIFRFQLEPGGEVKIGRAPENDVVLQDPTASRNHATIEFRGKGFFIKDNGSSHGTVHMGFRLDAGSNGARPLSPGDEFKVGESLFRVSFSEELQRKEEKKSTVTADSETRRSAEADLVKPGTKSKKYLIAVVLVGVLVASFVLFKREEKSGLPKQLSDVVMDLPQARVIGNLRVGKNKEDNDQTHLDKAQFRLPTSDLIVEYEFQSEAPVEVYLGKAFVEKIEPYTSGWQHRQTVVRDVLSGEERILIFDNTSYPPAANSKDKKLLRWAVKDVRAVPLTRDVDNNLKAQFNRAIAAAEVVDKSPESLFTAIRAFQRTLIEGLHQLNFDAVDYGIPVDASFPNPQELQATMLAMKNEQATSVSPETLTRHFNKLTEITGRLEGELWRRVNSRLIKVNSAVSVKDYIEAHDNLISIMAMFPDEDDQRWSMANEMFKNPKIVPKKVKARPERYRNKKK